MKPYLIAVILFLSGLAFADERANNYIDNFLSTSFASEVHHLELDPAAIPDFEIEFEEHVKVFGKVKGKASFENGNLEGLSEVERISECHSRVDTRSRSVNCTIRFEELKVKYEGKLKYGRIPKMNINAKAKVSDTQFFLEIVQDSPMQPILRNYSFVQMGKMKVKFTGLGPLNRFMNVLEEAYTKHARTLITSAMSQKLQYAMNRALSKDLLLF